MESNTKDDYQAELFFNRLSKRYKILRKWARKNKITCYRVYDRDIPEVPLAVDLYEFLPKDILDKKSAINYIEKEFTLISENNEDIKQDIAKRQFVTIYLYERPYEKNEEEENIWLEKMALEATKVFNILRKQIIIKHRKHDKGGSQYSAKEENTFISKKQIDGIVQECTELFYINLTKHIDTGLFFDNRPLRKIVKDSSQNKIVLNLYCYTGSFSVFAAAGNAKQIDSVDLSNTYLSIAKDNLILNNYLDENRMNFIHLDVKEFLKEKLAENKKYDIIVLDPPTFSNSKMANTILDLNKDWKELVNNCIKLLNNYGVLYFCTNSKRLKFSESLIKNEHTEELVIQNISDKTIPDDFLQKKPHRIWKIEKHTSK